MECTALSFCANIYENTPHSLAGSMEWKLKAGLPSYGLQKQTGVFVAPERLTVLWKVPRDSCLLLLQHNFPAGIPGGWRLSLNLCQLLIHPFNVQGIRGQNKLRE